MAHTHTAYCALDHNYTVAIIMCTTKGWIPLKFGGNFKTAIIYSVGDLSTQMVSLYRQTDAGAKCKGGCVKVVSLYRGCLCTGAKCKGGCVKVVSLYRWCLCTGAKCKGGCVKVVSLYRWCLCTGAKC